MNNHSYSKILVCSLQNNPLLASELERVGARRPLAAIDTARYQLTPSSTTPSTDEEWKSALDGAYALLEHQRIRYSNPYSQCDMPLIPSSRHNNLALLQQYGNNAWRVHNYLLEADTKKVESLLEELKERTTSLNRERKNAQVHVLYDLRHAMLTISQTRLGDQLTSLENRWTELISSILQIELANVALEAEVARLSKRETELAGAL